MSTSAPARKALDLRLLSPSDCEALSALLAQLEANLPGWSWTAGDAALLLTEWKVLGAFVSSSDRLESFLAYRRSGDVLEVGALATHPDARGRGCLSALFRQLKAGRPGESQEIWLEVSSANDLARRAYHSLGFRVVGTRPSYYRDGTAALLMTLAI